MTHIFIENGEGSSDQSLTAAIANAFGKALQAHNFGGDHLCSTTILIDGYDFDGTTYRVKVKVIIFDHELAHEDIYKEIEKMHEKQDMQKHLMDDYYAAMHLSSHMRHMDNHFHDMIHDMVEQYGHFDHLDNVSVIAPEPVHHLVAQEGGFEPYLTPVYRQAHVDLAAPTLGPGSSNDTGKTDKAA
jgi:hypothetical protein